MVRTAKAQSKLDPTAVALAFLAGAISVAVFQSGATAVLNKAGLAGAPWQLQPVPPFGVPQTLSAMFWGGLWGIVMLPALRWAGGGVGYWLTAILFGSIIVSAVLLFIVFPIKGRPVAAGWDMKRWGIICLLHAAFGVGTAALLRLFSASGRRM